MSDEEVEEEDEMQKTDNDVTSIPESDVTTMSDISVPDHTLETSTKYDIDSDGATLSDVGEEDNNDFSQWTDSMDALVASFDQRPESSTASTSTGFDVSQRSNESVQSTSTSNSPFSTPRRSRAGMMVGNTASAGNTAPSSDSPVSTPQQSRAGMTAGNTISPSAAKRHLAPTLDSFHEPPSSRQRTILSEAVTDGQSELSPLRKTLSSKLSLRTS